MNKYVVIKLSTGEELFAELVDNASSGVIRVNNPLHVTITREVDENGNTLSNVRAHPWCEYSADKMFDISKSHVVCCSNLHMAMYKHYETLVQAFSKEVVATEDEEGYLDEILDEYNLDEDEYISLLNPVPKDKPKLH